MWSDSLLVVPTTRVLQTKVEPVGGCDRSHCVPLLNRYPFVIIDCAENTVGHTPLLVAAIHGHLDMVTALLNMGAASRYQALDGNSMLSLAVFGGHLQLVRHLLKEQLQPSDAEYVYTMACV